MERVERIVLHIPHSSPVFPLGFGRWSQGIDEHIVRWTDWYTDWLFCQAAGIDDRIIPVSFPFSRFFCDPERLENDPLESVGEGIIYSDYEECHRQIADDEKKDLLAEFYYPFVDRLRRYLNPRTLLLDCHSFPSDLSDIEVCIGFNDDWSRPENGLLEKTEAAFTSHGLKTGFNSPYSNSISPSMPFLYRSMMIELNKRAYMNDSGELDPERARKVVASLSEVYETILGKT